MRRFAVGLVSLLLIPAGAGADAAGVTEPATGTVLRWSKTKNKHGRMQPPWTKVEITGLEMKRRLRKGESVTVVPFTAAVPPITLRVAAVRKGAVCTEAEPAAWQVTLEPVARRDFFAAKPLAGRAREYPFDVAVLYPAAPRARFLPRHAVDARLLPRGFKRHSVVAGIDLTGNGRPDILYLKFCTKARERHKPYGRCEYTSSATYMRRSGRWRKASEAGPC